MNTTPLCSIITPSYNSSEFIEDCITSVINQSYSNWELIVVDDCSTDDSFHKLKNFAKNDQRIRLIQLEQNSGSAVARNIALEVANGQYIAFLDSDDIWKPEKLFIQIGFMQSNGSPFSFTAYEKITSTGKSILRLGAPKRITRQQLLKTNLIGCSTVIYDACYFGKVQMPLVRSCQDFGLWLKLLNFYPYASGINSTLTKYRIHDASISANKIKASKNAWLFYRNFEKLSLLQSTYYFSHYAVRGIIRTYTPQLAKFLRILN